MDFGELMRITRERIAMFTRHGIVLLLQRSGVDDASEEASVANGVLFPLVALVQQLVVKEEQLAAQRVKLIHRSRAWGSHNNNNNDNVLSNHMLGTHAFVLLIQKNKLKKNPNKKQYEFLLHVIRQKP